MQEGSIYQFHLNVELAQFTFLQLAFSAHMAAMLLPTQKHTLALIHA